VNEWTHTDLTEPIVLFCAGPLCWESYNACLRAEQMGFTRIYWYRGGHAAWGDAGYAFEEAGRRHR
jgi:rhodanese-related sulfurtransferase